MAKERLDKVVATQCAVTRKEARRLIYTGAVRVNGSAEIHIDKKIETDTDRIEVNGTDITYKEHLYIMLNKPKGVISASNDPKAETVLDILPQTLRRKKLFPVGRLDKDTEGLLLITDDGDFAHRVIAPGKGVFKVYLAELDGDFTDDDVKRFEQGIEIDGGELCRPAKLKRYNNGIYNAEIHISEGKYHQVKRMAAAIGLRVLNLKRVRIGELELDANLKPGEARELTLQEIDVLIKNY